MPRSGLEPSAHHGRPGARLYDRLHQDPTGLNDGDFNLGPEAGRHHGATATPLIGEASSKATEHISPGQRTTHVESCIEDPARGRGEGAK